MKKPDRVADNKSTMPYGDSVSAPAITKVDTTGYRQVKSKEASAKLRGRYEELQEEFRQLVATSEDTQRMYDAAVSLFQSLAILIIYTDGKMARSGLA